ncbi:TrkH family potassium uptake protein [candidate division CSSED10-310 bacterium]|uniref:TrkH family potassium uptake protein n=1 Tax=candidate division CSSED10-310 bacterium TaxID=2855610 RepID=A0ABV6YS25_UNCC1
MNYKSVVHSISSLLLVMGFFFIFPLFFSLYFHDGVHNSLLLSMAITIFVGGTFFYWTRGKTAIRRREGFLVVTFSWVLCSFFGALPFYISGAIPSFTDAFFESMSGFTTTGASILTDIESVAEGLLFWRSLTHWLGGMGIIVLSLAILPIFGIGGMQLYKAEVPGPTPDRLKPRITETAKTLWIMYVLLSALQTILLLFGGMSFFDSLCHTFGTMATGGFSTKNQSIAAYDSVYIDGIITLFMFLAGINFVLHYAALKGNIKAFLKNAEFLFYVTIVVVGIILASLFLIGSADHQVAEAFRYASFQVVSIVTTTGYCTADFEQWPYFNQVLLFVLMFFGGCAGSTGGSIKHVRIMLLLKHAYVELYKIVHPKAVKKVKMGTIVVGDNIIHGILAFFLLYMAVLVLCSMMMAALGLDMVSAFASVTATLGNIGPGFGDVGPVDNYAHLPLMGKWILAFCMLAGRLEIYTVIILFIPELWKR